MKDYLEKLYNFKLLPVFVIVSMAAGVGISKIYGISNYQITPPVYAVKSLFYGKYEFTIANTLAIAVVLGLFMMIYPAMASIRFEDLGKSVKSLKQLLIVIFFNYAVAPFFMLFLARVFLSNSPDLYTGLVLYGIAPCIAMVIVFTYLAGGSSPLAVILVAVNSIIQMLLIPVYAKLLLGSINFDVWVVGESVVLYLGIPLIAGIMTRFFGVKRFGEEWFIRLKFYLDTVSIMGLLFTLTVMFALKGDLIFEQPLFIIQMAVPMTMFFFAMFTVSYLAGWKIGLSYKDSVAVAFNSTGRDFEIAIAIAITAFNPTVALSTVIGPLIEVPVMLALVWFAKNTEYRLFANNKL